MKVLLLLAFLSLSAFAQEIPDAPSPNPEILRPEETHRFFDFQNTAALTASLGVRLADTIQTCRLLRQRLIVTIPPNPETPSGVFTYPYFEEKILPTQSCAGVAAWNGGFAATDASISWLFHKTGHHKLERIPQWLSIGGSAFGIVKNSIWRYPSSNLAKFPSGTTYTHH